MAFTLILGAGSALLLGLAVWLAYKWGRSNERRQQVESTNGIKDQQLQDAAAPAPSPADILERMRRNGL